VVLTTARTACGSRGALIRTPAPMPMPAPAVAGEASARLGFAALAPLLPQAAQTNAPTATRATACWAWRRRLRPARPRQVTPAPPLVQPGRRRPGPWTSPNPGPKPTTTGFRRAAYRHRQYGIRSTTSSQRHVSAPEADPGIPAAVPVAVPGVLPLLGPLPIPAPHPGPLSAARHHQPSPPGTWPAATPPVRNADRDPRPRRPPQRRPTLRHDLGRARRPVPPAAAALHPPTGHRGPPDRQSATLGRPPNCSGSCASPRSKAGRRWRKS